jgi:hypothetical protein
MKITILTLLNIFAAAHAFAPSSNINSAVRVPSLTLSSTEEASVDESPRNPDRPELPEIKGDYDWDAKFAGDDDWIVDNVPGKMVTNEVELAAQSTELAKLEEGYRKIREQKEFDAARILGWTDRAEIFNGRFAMFFLVVGLLTEAWTGISIPGQIEEMARVGGFIGPDW